MGLGDLTLLLVGCDSLAQQLHVHLEHRGADIERTEASEALDTIRVAVPDLILISQDASTTDGERIRDGLAAAGGKPPRMLALCDKKLGAKIATYKHDFVATLETDAGAELIASCIESLCTLLSKPSSAARPLRSLVADVRRSHMPSKPLSPSKQTLAGTAPLVVPPPAAGTTTTRIAAPKPIAEPPKPIAAKQPIAQAPTPIADTPTPIADTPTPIADIPTPIADIPTPIAAAARPMIAPKPITSVAPMRASQPTPLSALLRSEAPATNATPIVRSVPAPVPALSSLTPAPTAIERPPATDDGLELDITAPSLSLPAVPPTSTPSPTPLFVETHTATPAPAAPSLRPSRLSAARALVLRLPEKQRYAAAAVVLLDLASVAAASLSSDDGASNATQAAASLSKVAHDSKLSDAPIAARAPDPEPAPAAPAPAEAPRGVEPTAAAEPIAESDEPEDSMVDGELYDPHADPARAKANYLVNMGHRLRKQGRLGMAEASYLKALKAMPNYARAVTGLVAVHLGRRDGVEALRWAKKLVELQPKRGAHQRLLGDAYALAGNKSAARSAWQLGARLGDRTSRMRMQ